MKIEASRRTLRTQVHAILRNELLTGRFAPGERVNEVQVAAEIGISRGTLREAMRNLEQEGLFVSIPHRGTFVRRFTVQEADELKRCVPRSRRPLRSGWPSTGTLLFASTSRSG
jgi:DNA-binding GntR family transcriptional regulator